VFTVKALVVRGIEGAEEGPGKSEEEMEGGRNLTGESGKTGIPESSEEGEEGLLEPVSAGGRWQ